MGDTPTRRWTHCVPILVVIALLEIFPSGYLLLWHACGTAATNMHISPALGIIQLQLLVLVVDLSGRN